jgi:3-oxoacyl-[acyl-carrier protein] reductase
VNNAGVVKDSPFPTLAQGDWEARDAHVARRLLQRHAAAGDAAGAPAAGDASSTSPRWPGLVGNRGQVSYSAAKAGLIGATRSLSKEVAKRNVTVNAVAPGLIDTDMLKQIPVDDLTKLIPMRRLGMPSEVAEAGAVSRQRRRRVHHRPGDHHRRRAGVSSTAAAS